MNLYKIKNVVFSWIIRNYYQIIISLVGIFLRMFKFGSIPNGITTDEAMTGYNAWTLLHYHTDMWGYHYPFYLKAWGSGMNALYEYLLIPIIKIWGLNIYTERSISLILGILLLPLFYLFLKKIWNKQVACIGLTLLSINPWAIMIARQGLESNILPFTILISFTLFANKYYRWAAAFFAISIYAYSSVLLALPIMIFILYVWALYKHQITLRMAFESFGVFLVVSLPMLLWVAVNIFNIKSFDIGVFSVEKFTMIRQTIGGDLKSNVTLLLTQFDGLMQNGTKISSYIYIILLIFAFIGLIQSIICRKIIILAWLSGIISLIFLVQGNVNRYNLSWLLVLMLSSIGLWNLLIVFINRSLRQRVFLYLLLIIILIIPHCIFLNSYFRLFNSLPAIQDVYNQGFEQSLNRAKKENKSINIVQPANQRYSLVLFYDRPTPQNFMKTVQVEQGEFEFTPVTKFTNYTFTVVPVKNNNTVVIAPTYVDLENSEKEYDKQSFGIYTVYIPR
ncbi:hypothetical protein [Weissella koreensis]|uniref:hypothetical protein n=1 Tax=Weissella koreensis TaxID=165096 RepID=UPI000CF32552|nr:hypothetical protein [Weissella koreensis]AVH75876.1 hypothetical protein C4597_07545 [Weissella koreensis]